MYTIWQETLFFRLLLPFMAGIIAAIFIDLSLLTWSTAFGVFLVIFYLHHRNESFHLHYYGMRWVTGLLLSLPLVALGGVLTEYHKELPRDSHFAHHEDKPYAKVKLTFPPVEKENSLRAKVTVQQLIDSSGKTYPVTGKALLYLEKDALARSIFYGDVLLIKNRLEEIGPPKNPGEFDYEEYMSFQQIHHRTFLDSSDWVHYQSNRGNPFYSTIYEIRHYFLAVLERQIQNDEALAVASALLLGYRAKLGNDVVLAYSSSGAMHVLAVSGLHVGIIFLILRSALAPLYRKKNWEVIGVGITLLCIWLYAMLTGLAPSVLRASTMFSLIIIGTTIRRDTNIYNILAATAFLLLCFDPFLIMEVGFQLSFCAVAGIVFLQPKIYNLLIVRNWLGDKIWAITAVSFAAQLSTFPISLLYFHQFPTLFPISNLIVIPAAFAILHVGLGLFALHWLKYIGDAVGWLLNTMITWLNKAIFFLDNLPYSLIQGISISVPESWLIYILTFGTVFFMVHQRWLYLQGALVAALLLTGWNSYESWQQSRQQSLTVYKVDNRSAIELRDGSKAVFLADSSLLANESRMLFHIKHNWWDNSLQQVEKGTKAPAVPKASAITRQDNFYQLGNSRIGIIDHKLPKHSPKSRLTLDYLILRGNPEIDIQNIDNWFEVDHLIIDSSTPAWRARKWKTKSEETGIHCYAVPLNNAFVANL
jgi:competence protein ComEC